LLFGMNCMERGNKEGQFMGIRLSVEFGQKYPNSRGDKYNISICHRPLEKHSLARGSREAKRIGFRGIMGQAKEKKTTLELKDIYFSSGQTVVESPPDIWLQMEAK